MAVPDRVRWNEIDALFVAVLEQPAAEREAYLRAAGDDADLIAAVRALLRAAETPSPLDDSLFDLTDALLRDPPRQAGDDD